MAMSRPDRTTNIFGWSSFCAALVLLLIAAAIGQQRTGSARERIGEIAGFPPGRIDAVTDGFSYPVPGTRVELVADLRAVTDAADGTYGVYVIELDTGAAYGINEDMYFEAASTNKIPVLVTLYSEIAAGRVSRDQVLTYTWGDFEEGTGSIQTTAPGSRWTVAQLAEKMIRESDNIAKNMLLGLLGYGRVEDFVRGMGVDFSLYYNTTTPRAMAQLLRLLYEERIVDNRHTYEMLGLLLDTEFEDRLPRYLDGVPVANKVGTMDDSINDVGIVLLEDRPYVVSIYSDGVSSYAAAEETVGRISAYIYYFEINRPGAARGPAQ